MRASGSFESEPDSQKGKFSETAFAWSFVETNENSWFAMSAALASVSLFAKPIVIAMPFAGVDDGRRVRTDHGRRARACARQRR